MLATALALALIGEHGVVCLEFRAGAARGAGSYFPAAFADGEIAYLNESVWISARLRISTGERR